MWRYSESALDVCVYFKSYTLETSKFRNENPHDLFLSWATIKPVTEVSQAKWLKSVLSLVDAKIDSKVFSDHSYRGDSLSFAYNKGVSLNDTFKAGDWPNEDIFSNHYYDQLAIKYNIFYTLYSLLKCKVYYA